MKSTLIFLLVFGLLGFNNKPDQLVKTSLTVTVRDELGNIVEGASVKLFLKEEDYNKEVNQADEGITDKKGVFRFKKLQPQVYFILCRKGDKDNAGGGAKTEKLDEARFNKITIIIQ